MPRQSTTSAPHGVGRAGAEHEAAGDSGDAGGGACPRQQRRGLMQAHASQASDCAGAHQAGRRLQTESGELQVHVMNGASKVLAVQVLNMKPQEILGMLEEAAGTRMYETKKEAALRTLEKKQVKVQEIEKVLSSVPPVNPSEPSLDQ